MHSLMMSSERLRLLSPATATATDSVARTSTSASARAGGVISESSYSITDIAADSM